MADMMQFDLVSPERMLASLQASEIEIPGAEGDFTAMADHATLVTTLRPGILKVKGADGVSEFVVTGGFVEITAGSASVLAEAAVPRADVTRAIADQMIAEAEARVAETNGIARDSADKRLADTRIMVQTLGL
ncbi:MAG: F0F1 ATP synthase subunit epsilon [Rhodobacteraceae bacterium]|nr:F0F1 ATP synthase subunit epsilon [Paracoccaceae bacterium]